MLGAIAFKLMQDLISAWTPQYWTFWLGLFLVVLVLVGRERFLRPWTWRRGASMSGIVLETREPREALRRLRGDQRRLAEASRRARARR